MNAITSDQLEASVSWAHKFTLDDWNGRASVRTSQHTYQLPDDLQEQLKTRHWFPPAFLPYLAHPAIRAAGSDVVQRLTANHLVHFLDYTTLLEHRIVNRAVETIVHGELPAFVPSRMKNAALQLYTDEAYHALFSNQLAEQIASQYGITERPVMPMRITQLNTAITRVPETDRPLAWFLLGFVSETIIARELLEVCRDTLVSSVSDMLRDHLADEARHSRYFSEVFHYLWLTLNSRQRTFSARMLLEFLRIFFEVDERWLKQSLRSVGIADDVIRKILDGLISPRASRQRTKAGAKATLEAMTKAGFFALINNRKLFAKAGLVDE